MEPLGKEFDLELNHSERIQEMIKANIMPMKYCKYPFNIH